MLLYKIYKLNSSVIPPTILGDNMSELFGLSFPPLVLALTHYDVQIMTFLCNIMENVYINIHSEYDFET